MKKWYRSKTIWSGLSMVALAISQNLPLVQSTLDPKLYVWLLFFFGVLKVGLRFVTDEALGPKE